MIFTFDWISFVLGFLAASVILLICLTIAGIIMQARQKARDEAKAKKMDQELEKFKDQMDKQQTILKEKLEQFKKEEK